QASQLYNTEKKDDLPGLLVVESYQINKENGGLQNDPDIYNALSAISNDQVILRGHMDGVRSIVLAKDGKTLFSCGDDNNLLMWKLNDPQSPPVRLDIPKQGKNALRSVGLTYEGRWLIAGSTSGDLVIWKCSSLNDLARIVSGHTSVLNELAMHPAKKIFASAGSDGKLLLWNYENDLFKKTLIDSVAEKISCVSFSPDGTWLAYGTGGGAVKTIFMNGQHVSPIILLSSGNAVLSLAFNKDGKSLAAGLSNGTIKVWNITELDARPQEILGRHASGVTALTFSQDGSELASSSYDRTMKLAGFPSQEVKPISIENHDLWVYDILFTPDNSQLISCSADKTIRIVSTENDRMAEKLRKELKRNLTTEEWKKMVGGDIPYKKTRPDLP
ncbi:MAG: WD40 repeat domain-containing protein, partial [Bacteroidales bacterium]